MIAINVPREHDATFRMTFYAPRGYRGVLGQAAGTQVGTLTASIQALRTSPDAVLPLTVFKFQGCLASPHVPEEAGGAPLGGKLLTATLRLQNGLVTAPSTAGRLVWPAFFTPWPAGPGLPNTAGTVQARAVVRIPGRVTARMQYNAGRNTWRLTGSVTENGAGVRGATVDILRGTRPTGLARILRVRSGASGSFTASGRLRPRARAYFRARAVVPNRVNTTVGCAIAVTGLPAAPGGCLSAVYGGFTAESAIVSVRPPRR